MGETRIVARRLRTAGVSLVVAACVAGPSVAEDSSGDLVMKPASGSQAGFDGGPAMLAKLRIAMPDGRQYRPVVQRAARANGLPDAFLDRILRRESQYFALAQSRAGAQGIAQFMPATASDRHLADPYDVNAAIPAAAAYLSQLRRQFRGDLNLAAAAYNAGPGVVRDWLAGRRRLPRETLAYVLWVTGADLSSGGETTQRPAKSTLPASRLSANRGLTPESKLCAAISTAEHPCRVADVY